MNLFSLTGFVSAIWIGATVSATRPLADRYGAGDAIPLEELIVMWHR